MHWLVDPFSSELSRTAAIELILLAMLCAPVGVWVILRGEQFLTESLGHGVFPGLVLAGSLELSTFIGTLAGIIFVLLSLLVIRLVKELARDVAVAITIAAAAGVGGLLAALSPHRARPAASLFGDVIGATWGDLTLAAVLAVCAATVLVFWHRNLLRAAFGERSHWSDLLLWAVLAICVAVAAPIIGTLLVFALVVAPAAAALNVGVLLRQALLSAPVIAIVATVVAIVVSYNCAIALSGSVALALFVSWIALSVVGWLRGSERAA